MIDYTQTAEDHQSFLVLVRQTGTRLTNKAFNRVWERVQRLTSVSIPGQKRIIWVRYKRGYSKENNEWGDFQAHRKTLGLVSIGKCYSQKDFDELFENYKSVKEEYASTLFNSRLIVFGLNRDGSSLSEEQKRNLSESECDHSSLSNSPDSESDDSNTVIDPQSGNTCQNDSDSGIVPESGEEIQSSTENCETPVNFSKPHSNSLTKESTGAEVVFYPSLDDSKDLEEKLKEFIMSLFFVLDGKRLDRSFERMDRMQLLCAPFEKRDYVGVDTDTKSFRKRCQGRLRKHLADLCLQAGLPGEAMLHYQTSLDILKAVNDWLWIGGCYEGLCAASVILTYPRKHGPPLRRNVSMSTKRGSSMMHEAKMRTVNGLPDVPEMAVKACLNPTDIIEKYKDTLQCYSKYKNAGLIEIEASIKACKVLIVQMKFLQASDFLQNVVYVNLPTSDEDRISRYCTLSTLYTQLGFHRKAAFYKRIAAMQCVAPQNPKPNWNHCYNLLIESLEGYKICFNPREVPRDHPWGWPVIQTRVVHEMIFCARKMANLPLAVRHTTFLLHTMLPSMSPHEKKELAGSLENITDHCEGTPQPLAIDSGIILPPVPLTNLPFVKSFKLICLQPHLEPVKMSQARGTPTDHGPFIYTPLTLGQDPFSSNPTKADFRWVVGDVSEIHLQVTSPMPEELKITQLGLLTDGAEIEVYPTSPSIPAQSGPYLVKLMTRPKTPGELNIFGYTTQVLGVRSHCRLKDLDKIPQSHFSVDIVPSLPQIQLTSSLPKAASFTTVGDGANVVTSGTTILYAGQSQECLVTVQNTSMQPVERMSVSLQCKTELTDYLNKVFDWSSDDVKSQLPIKPASISCFSVCIYGHADFLPSVRASEGSFSSSHSSRQRSDSVDNKFVEALLQLEYSGGPGLAAGYCRQCSVALSVDILQSVIFLKWDVLPSSRHNHCFLVFDVQNVSSHQMDIVYADQTLTMNNSQIRRVAIEIECCVFPLPPLRKDDHWNSIERPVNHYSQYLSTFVDIRWSIPVLNVRGIASIEHLLWTEEQLERIRMPSVSWDVKVNNKYYRPEMNSMILGDMVTVCVMFSCQNITADQCATLTVECYQDTCLSCGEHSLTDKLVFMGPNSLIVPKIEGSEKFGHTWSFLFLCCGVYKLEIRCLVMSKENPEECQTWKYSPVIELTVVDQ